MDRLFLGANVLFSLAYRPNVRLLNAMEVEEDHSDSSR